MDHDSRLARVLAIQAVRREIEGRIFTFERALLDHEEKLAVSRREVIALGYLADLVKRPPGNAGKLLAIVQAQCEQIRVNIASCQSRMRQVERLERAAILRFLRSRRSLGHVSADVVRKVVAVYRADCRSVDVGDAGAAASEIASDTACAGEIERIRALGVMLCRPTQRHAAAGVAHG